MARAAKPPEKQPDGAAVDAAALAGWVGRSERVTDTITGAPLVALSALLDRDDPRPRPGDAIPPLAHWLYFLPAHRQSAIGPDGHAARGGFLPPVPLPRRMWAGSRLEFPGLLRVGEEATRVSTIARVEVKQGRSGALVFVTVRHEISGPAGLSIVDEHDIVYRGAGGAAAPGEPAPAEASWRREIRPDPVLLFRYSAATGNGHRIHYDHPYTTRVEGYPGLVVHGPLIATLLVDLWRRNTPGVDSLATFRFRALRPLFDTAPFETLGASAKDARAARLWTRDAEGMITMDAEATW